MMVVTTALTNLLSKHGTYELSQALSIQLFELFQHIGWRPTQLLHHCCRSWRCSRQLSGQYLLLCSYDMSHIHPPYLHTSIAAFQQQ